MNSCFVQQRYSHPLKVLRHKHEDWYSLWDIRLRDKLPLDNSIYFSFDIVDLSFTISRRHSFYIHEVFGRLYGWFSTYATRFHIQLNICPTSYLLKKYIYKNKYYVRKKTTYSPFLGSLQQDLKLSCIIEVM